MVVTKAAEEKAIREVRRLVSGAETPTMLSPRSPRHRVQSRLTYPGIEKRHAGIYKVRNVTGHYRKSVLYCCRSNHRITL